MSIQYTFPHTLRFALIGLIEHASVYVETWLERSQELTPSERFALAAIFAAGPNSHRTLQAQLFAAVNTTEATATLAAPSPYLVPAIITLGTQALRDSMNHLDHATPDLADDLRQLHDHDIPAIRDVVERQTPNAPLLAA